MSVSINPLEKLSIDDLKEVQNRTWKVRAKWYNFGVALDLSADTLDAIKNTHRGDSEQCYTETLKAWLRRAITLMFAFLSMRSVINHRSDRRTTVSFVDVHATQDTNCVRYWLCCNRAK